MLDFSRRAELAPFAPVVGDLETSALRTGVSVLLAGAFARDLHLRHAHGFAVTRRTEDLDFGVAVRSWAEFEALRQDLITAGGFGPGGAGAPQRLLHPGGLPVDLVPFAGVEDSARRITWPPRGDLVMDTFGFAEASRTAEDVLLPGGARTRAVSLPSLAMLKLVAWEERHLRAPRKDAQDLMQICSNYLGCGRQDRLFTEFEVWTAEPDFDYEDSGARLLGLDIGATLGPAGRRRIAEILRAQTDESRPGILPREMDAHDPARALRLLRSLLRGLDGLTSPIA